MKKDETNKKIIEDYVQLRRFMFFLIRVFLVKPRSKRNIEQFTKHYKKLWPHLMSELVSIFERPKNDSINPLIIEAIKLIELQASMNMEDF